MTIKRADLKALCSASLTDTERVILLALLAASDAEDTSITALCSRYGLKRSAVAKAVRRLRDCGVIGDRMKGGRKRLYIKTLDELALSGQLSYV